jgi:hypothetical protein
MKISHYSEPVREGTQHAHQGTHRRHRRFLFIEPGASVGRGCTQGPDASAELKVANRSVMVFRATVLGEPPQSRVKRAGAVIREALDEADDLNVSIDPVQNSYLVLLGTRRAFIVSPKTSTAWAPRQSWRPPSKRRRTCVR